MKKHLIALTFCVLLGSAGYAQSIKPTPQPSPTPDNDVVKISTNLIQVDVTVVDGNGKIIKDLRPDEIVIYANGEKQKLTNFSFISSVKETGSTPRSSSAKDSSPSSLPRRPLTAEQAKRAIALVVDDLSLSFDSIYYTRRTLKKFVEEQMLEGDLIAIFRTGSGIGTLQQFTSDKRVLYAAIESLKWNSHGSSGMGAFTPVEPTPLEILKGLGDKTITAEAIAAQKDRAASADALRAGSTSLGTLGAVEYIIGGMDQLPGRKSVILITHGFRLVDILENGGIAQNGMVLSRAAKLVDAANRASVVIYTIDPRGVVYTGATVEDKLLPGDHKAYGDLYSNRRAVLLETQEGAGFLASQTGGFDIKNTNDLSGGLRQILDDQSYYLVGYVPDSDIFDPSKRKFDKLDIRVTRPNATVRTRGGFVSVADKSVRSTASPTENMTPAQRVGYALMSPFGAKDISVRLNALFANDEKDGSYIRSLLHIDAKDLTFTEQPDGTKRAEFTVAVTSFGDNGLPAENILRSYILNVHENSYKTIMADGFVYHFTFPVKNAGAYQLRLAIRDAMSGKIGAASQFITIPKIQKDTPVLSGIGLDSLTREQWLQASSTGSLSGGSDAMTDTALRRFKQGTVLGYGFEIYGVDASKNSQLQKRVRVFADGKLLMDGRATPVDLTGQTDVRRIKVSGAFSLGKELPPGDYVMQVVVTDPLKPKEQTVTQYVEFEIIE